jgi:hypothetical protein
MTMKQIKPPKIHIKYANDFFTFLKLNYPEVIIEKIKDDMIKEYLNSKTLSFLDLGLFLTGTGLMKKEVEQITSKNIFIEDNAIYIEIDKKVNKTTTKRTVEDEKAIITKEKETLHKIRRVKVLFDEVEKMEEFKLLLKKIQDIKKPNEKIFDKELTAKIKNYQGFRVNYAQRLYKRLIEENQSYGTLNLDFTYNRKSYDLNLLTIAMDSIDFLLNEDRYSSKKAKNFIDIILYNKNFINIK